MSELFNFPKCADDMCSECGVMPKRAKNVQWPLKIMRISAVAPYFHNANLVIAADCCGYSGFENSRDDNVVIVGCPDGFGLEFYNKLEQIISYNDIRSIRLIRMDAACCTRMTDAVILALRSSGKDLRLQITSYFIEGEIIE